MSASAGRIADDTPVHRIGGGDAGNLALKPAEATLQPPGISTFSGGSVAEAAEAMRRRFPRMAPRGKTAVGSTTAGQIRQAGFDVIMNHTPRFPQHARRIHPDGTAGFSQENLDKLAQTFTNVAGL